MKRWSALGVMCLFATVAMGQTLAEVAKKEKARRKQNQQKGVAARTVTERDVEAYAAREADLDSRAEEAATDEDIQDAIRQVVGGSGPDSSAPAAETTPAAPNRPAPMGPAPPFSLPDRTGRTYSLRDFLGRPMLVDFWATWCGPCRSTMPQVENLHRKYRGRGLQVVGINIEGKSEGVTDFLDQSRYSFLILFDSGNWKSQVAKDYSVSSIPRTFLIDRDGNIVYSGHPGSLSEALIEATLQ